MKDITDITDMTEMSLDEIKQTELGVLEKIAGFCRENGLRYYLAYGTLLGAVRHKGFIPWDDDVDIVMPRPDYNKLIKMFIDERFIIYSPINKKNHNFTYAKAFDNNTVKVEDGMRYGEDNVCGVDIDIFPVDGCPEDQNEFADYEKKQIRLFKIYEHAVSTNVKSSNKVKKSLKCIVVFFIKLYGKKRLIRRINANACRYDFDGSNKVAVSIAPHSGKVRAMSTSIYADAVEMVFEGKKFAAPIGYDEFLSSMYSDYMKLPSEENQVCHHTYKAFRKG